MKRLRRMRIVTDRDKRYSRPVCTYKQFLNKAHAFDDLILHFGVGHMHRYHEDMSGLTKWGRSLCVRVTMHC
jgi:hypothetical protein